ncbi:MAG TPA: LON peptidase substrate-binding domain-containing protein [Ilumatobacteraceae bacterium]|nr:LON peptidase substrate-binding domain-containing protein [Ilumatobacteraceae bacterium]
MPMFPLGTVLLPGAVLPLHVFEPRYQQMVRDCVDSAEQEFGVVLIDRGSEVGGGDSRLGVGVVAKLLQVSPLGDGRFAVLAVGARRIRVNEWLADDPYPRADVDDWPDEDMPDHSIVPTGLLEAASARAKRCAALAVELGDRSGVPEIELTGDPSVDTYLLGLVSPFGAADLYAVLCAPGAAARLELIDRLLGDVEAAQRFRLG